MPPWNIMERDRLLNETSVLFVDDDPIARIAFKGLLADALKILYLASGGQEGLFTYALHKPDIVVTDVSMPGMDGLAMAQGIRGIKPDVPVLLLTSFDDPSLFRQAIALGVTDFMTKPMEPTVLKDTLARVAAPLHLKRELERQLQLNQLMLDAAPSPSILVELVPGRIVASNQLASELGYHAGQGCDGTLIPVSLLTELCQGGEKLIRATSSREVYAHGRYWVLHWAPVGHGAILFTAVDITQRVKVEQFRDDVERITRHDLKTPLSAFTAVPDLLLMDDNLTEQQRMYIQLIQDAGMRMLGMINLSLDLFKMEIGKYRLPEKQFDFVAVLRQALSAASHLGQNLGVGLEGAVNLKAEQHILMRGDELLCLTMLENLLKNALEASPRGEVVHLGIATRPRLELTIRNSGEVPHHMRGCFFEKYTTSGKQGGTGLGTYSALAVVRAHNGDIILDTSEPGNTTVRILLPTA